MCSSDLFNDKESLDLADGMGYVVHALEHLVELGTFIRECHGPTGWTYSVDRIFGCS